MNFFVVKRNIQTIFEQGYFLGVAEIHTSGLSFVTF